MISPFIRTVLDQYLSGHEAGEFPGYPRTACPFPPNPSDPDGVYIDYMFHHILVTSAPGSLGAQSARAILAEIQQQVREVNRDAAELALPISRAQDAGVAISLERLTAAAIEHGYDQWVSVKPPLRYPAPARVIDANAPLSDAVVSDSLHAWMRCMSTGGWDRVNEKLWFARKETRGPQHTGETGIHPELVGILVPQVLVDAYFHAATLELAGLREFDRHGLAEPAVIPGPGPAG